MRGPTVLVRRLLSITVLFVAVMITMGMRQPGRLAVITALVDNPSVQAGSTIPVTLRVLVPEGLHAQSNAPRDPALIPTSLRIDVPSTVIVIDTLFPPSTDFIVKGFPQPLAVFEGEFDVKVQLSVSAEHPPGPLTIPVRFRYQACDATACFPPRNLDASWTVEVTGSTPARAARPTLAATRTTRSETAVPRASAPSTGSAPPAVDSPVAAADVSAVQSAPVLAAPALTTVFAAGSEVAAFEQFTIIGSAGGYIGAQDFVKFIQDSEAGVRQAGLLEGRGWLAILALVFIGGLALNLTPCVLPMIPINLAIIGAGAQGANRSRGFWLGAAYGGAMALVYGVLGLVVILTAGSFGTINASWWFNLAMALLFVFLGLAMFDVFSLGFSRWSRSVRFDPKSRGTFYLSFGMGAVAALLAGACVAPVVIQVIVFASNLYAGGTAIALALPFFLGLGMALPWPFAGAGLTALPKPGRWMVRVKQAMGVFILVSAAYYGYIAYGIFASRWVDAASVTAGVEDKLKEGWHASLLEGLRVAQAEDKLVLVDLWATWCKNCFAMDETTMKDPAVKAALANYALIKFQAEDPDVPPAREIMQRISAVGLPAYAILRPGSAE